jgi:outer membrane receptor protein involved in Fe transport
MARRHNRNLLCCALASCLAVAAPAAFAQSTAATIRGQVVVDSAPAANAQVTATNLATGLKRTVQTADNGSYTLVGLPPGSYRIDVAAAGQTNSKDVTVMVGQTATLNLGVGGLAATATTGGATTLGTVEVVGAALAETKTSEVATYISQKQIEALPQASRNFLAFADTVPGMIFETGADDSTKLRGGAQNSNGINVFIDGVGQKNYVLKGGISGQDSSRGNPFPQLGIGEYKVITSNYKAEYDQISSAAVVAVTRSGTNEFHGSVFGDYTDQDWRASTPSEERTGTKPDTKTEQYGAALGGPIVQDQLFYFLTYEHKEITSPRDVNPGANYPVDLLPPELAALTGPTNSPFDEDLWFGKLTWQPGEAHLFELSTKYRDESEFAGIGGVNTDSYGSSKDNTSTRVDLRYQYSNYDWLNDAHLTYEDESWNPRAITIAPGFNFLTPSRETILNVGGGADFQDKGQKGTSLQDDLSYFGWAGHTLKMGVKYKTVEINAFEQQPYNPQFRIDLLSQLLQGHTTADTFVPYEVSFGAPLPGVGDRNIQSDNKQFGVYFQDDWEVNDKLTLNLGLRYDYERTPGYEDYVTPAGIVSALQAWPNIHGPNVDYDINDYISTGSNRSAFDGAWQPRLGFSYDVTGDERHVFFGGAGRSYDRNLFDYLALEQSKSTFPGYLLSFNTPEHPCTVGVNRCYDFSTAFYDPDYLYSLVAADPNLGAEVYMINNDLKTPYSDQFSFGMRNTFPFLGHEWNTSATIAHIRSHDGVLFTLGNRWPDGSYRDPAFPDATWGHQPWDFPIPGYGRLILADNGIETRLNTLLLSAEKVYTPDSPWAMTIAYTYSNATENRLNAANSDEHSSFDYPNLDGLPFLTSVGIPKQRLVVTGIVDVWGMSWSGKLTLATPTPKDSINCHNTTSFDNCYFDKFVPPGNIGFKQFDLAVRKEWRFGNDMGLWIRGDLLNAFNWRNWTDYDTWRGGPSPDINNNFAHRTGDGIVYPTRTFKLSAGFDW